MRALLLFFVVATLGCSKAQNRNDQGPSPGSSATASMASGRIPIDASPIADIADAPRSVLLITVDSLRADMPWAGYARPIAPRLTELHDRSVRYTHAYATSSFTSKSIPGLLTGRYPSELARTGSFFTKYLAADQFACTHLGAAGIPCVGGHAHMYFGPGQSGFETGFAAWKIVPGITFDYQTDPYVTSDKLTPLAIEMLKEVSTKPSPFVAWFHFMDPHDEYKPHDDGPHFGKRARDLYDEEVFFTDRWVGKLLDFVASQPWSKQTAIILTADHGEAFGEHGITRHAHEVWEELVHVPLFVHVPGIAARTIDVARGHADVMPTIVDLVGAKNVPALPGKSLLPEVRGGEAPRRDVIVDLPEDDHNERRRALVHEEEGRRVKLIAFGNDARFALYDLEADPKEADDLIVKRSDLAADMRARYLDAKTRIVEVAPRGGIPGKSR